MTNTIINKFDINKYDFIPIIDIKTFLNLSRKNKDFTIKRLDNIFNNYRITYYNYIAYEKYYDTKSLILDEIIIKSRKKGGKSNKFCNENTSYNTNSDDIIINYMKGDPEAIKIIDKYPEIKELIGENGKFKEKQSLEVVIDSKNGFVNKKIYEFCDYNKDKVLAFEKNFIDNIEVMNKYIEKQNKYISTLSIKERYTLYDYSNKISSSVYRKFRNNNKEWINDIKQIGDAFLPQIYKIIYDNDNDNGNDNDKQKLPNNRNINSKSLFDFDIRTWIKVLNTFTDDLDKIIRESPKLDDDIYCYRGCSNYEYNAGVYSEKNSFKLALYKYYIPIATSFTLSYDIAKEYYNSKLGFPILYRVTIMKGCNALFISNNDFELIIPSYSIVAKTTSGGDSIGINYNNRDNTYGICGYSKNVLTSLDIIITSTAKFKLPLELKVITINKPQSITKLSPEIIVFNFKNWNGTINIDDKKYKTYLNNIMKQLEYLGYFLIEKTNNNFIFLKSHIFHIIDIKTIKEKSGQIITFIHNTKELKLGVFDDYVNDIGKKLLDIIIKN
jgi:hypothetical protein